jgi:hypothetical protein
MNIGKNGVEEIKFQGGREKLDENSVPAITRKSPTRIFHKDELDTNHVRPTTPFTQSSCPRLGNID